MPERCGWIKDKYGVSWQIVPVISGQMLGDKNTEKSESHEGDVGYAKN